MNDAEVFTRFVHEMRSLLGAIEAYCASLGDAAASEQRPQALREMARLSRAAAALAQVFAVDDLCALADALADAATITVTDAEARGDAAPFFPFGSRDALLYMRWRVERLAAAGRAEPPAARDLAIARRLEQTLRAQPDSHLGDDEATSSALADASELTLAELALVQSFSGASLRKRDKSADERLLARIAEQPAFMAQTHGGADIPVFGGVTAAELNDVPPEMKRNHVNETRDDLRDLGQLVMEFERRPNDARSLGRMAFITHKIKGGAATMGFPGLSEIAKLLQDVVESAQRTDLATNPAFLPGLGRFHELLEQALAAAAQFGEPAPALLDDARRLRDALLYPHAEEEFVAQQPQAGASSANASDVVERVPSTDPELTLRIEAHKLDMLMNLLSALAANRGAVTRNRNEIAQAQAEMQATLTRLREKSTQITDAHPLTYDNLISTDQAIGADHAPGDSAPAKGEAPEMAPTPSQTPSGVLRASRSNLQLEQYTEIDTALRALAEVVADVTANYGALNALLSRLGQLTEAQEMLSRDIQGDAMSIRLARLAEIAAHLSLSAKVAAANLGKQLEFEVQGDDVEIDRMLLKELEQPLVQLVRNAVAHGVEAPEERVAQGKAARGRVWLHAYNVGSEVVIEVGDDGRGADADLLVDAAIRAELISSEEARRLTREQALSLMFQLGVTTLPATSADGVGAMAGSGIGLADVANTVYRLRGAITVRSEPGKGSTFQIRVPISLSMLPVLEVSAVGQVFALPFALVEYSTIVEPERLREVAPTQASASGGARLREWVVTPDTALPPTPAGGVTELDGAASAGAPAAIRAYALAEVLGFEQDATELRRMVVITTRGQTVGLLVESVGDGDVREATVRPLPRRLQRRVVRGAIVRPEDGQMALLIDPHTALEQRLAGAVVPLRPGRPPAEPRSVAPGVLIVDDSVTIRRTLEQTLTQAGFKTRLACDGAEALELMEHELPRIVILDVEMPRLSGFELLARMRETPRYQQVRVAMLTSRASERHREQALALGADVYLVKPCPQEILVETIRRLLSESEP